MNDPLLVDGIEAGARVKEQAKMNEAALKGQQWGHGRGDTPWPPKPKGGKKRKKPWDRQGQDDREGSWHEGSTTIQDRLGEQPWHRGGGGRARGGKGKGKGAGKIKCGGKGKGGSGKGHRPWGQHGW